MSSGEQSNGLVLSRVLGSISYDLILSIDDITTQDNVSSLSLFDPVGLWGGKRPS